MAGLCSPPPTLRLTPHDARRMTRGQCGSLRLHCEGLSPSTPCRSPGAHWVHFVIRAWRLSTCRRGCFAVLIWWPVRSRSAGELPLSGRAYPFAAWPSFQWLNAYWAGVARSGRGPARWPGDRVFLVLRELTLWPFPCYENRAASRGEAATSRPALTQAKEVSHGSG